MRAGAAYTLLVSLLLLSGCSDESNSYLSNPEFEARRFSYDNKTYFLELATVETEFEFWHVTAVSRAGVQFADTPSDRAEAEAVARAYCRTLSTVVPSSYGPREVEYRSGFVRQAEAAENENSEWRFHELCVDRPKGDAA